MVVAVMVPVIVVVMMVTADDLRLFPAGRGAAVSLVREQHWPPHHGRMRQRGARAVPSAVCVGGSSVAGAPNEPST